MSNQTAVATLISLGRKADEANDAAVVVQAEGDGNLGAFRAAVAVALAPLKKAAREEVLVALKDAGVRSVPGVSTNVATTYQLIGQFLVAHPEEPAVLSGAEFEKSYTKIKAALYSSSKVNISVERARRILAKAETLEDAAQACADAAPADVSFAKKVKEALKAISAVNEAVEAGQVDPEAADLLAELLEASDVLIQSFPDGEVVELAAQHAAEIADAA